MTDKESWHSFRHLKSITVGPSVYNKSVSCRLSLESLGQSLYDVLNKGFEEEVKFEMSRISAKDVLTGKIPEVNYLIVHDKGLADDFAVAINILTSQGWSIEQIWAAGAFHFALFKRK